MQNLAEAESSIIKPFNGFWYLAVLWGGNLGGLPVYRLRNAGTSRATAAEAHSASGGMASLVLQAPDIRRANDKVHDKIDQHQDFNSCSFVAAAPQSLH